MNKTITSNIAGYVFHIDENAFDKLDAYLNTIRSYFSDSQGKDEIIADIEARLAEMLQEKIGSTKEVVTMDDVNHVIGIMGQPESFIDDDPETSGWSEQRSDPRRESNKRLFRDPDSRVVGGVCSGVSQYLGIGDPIWLRLALVISVFFFGTGFLLYLILWIIIPEARNTAEKLQMRGENVTVSNIEKKVNEEMETVKNKWNEFHGNNGAGRKVGNFFHRLITLVVSLITMFIKFIAKIIGFVFLMVGLIGFLSLMSIPFGLPAMISLGNDGVISSFVVQDILNNLVGGTGILILIMISGVLVLGVPLIALAYLGLRLLVNFKSHFKGVGLSLIALFIIGVVMSFAVSMIVASDFSSEGSNTETVELHLATDPDKTIALALNHELGDDEPNVEANVFDLNLITAGNSTQIYGKPELDINMAKTGGPKLIIKRLARAKKKQDAVERASKIEYGFTVSDTAILFNGYFAIPEDELWRSQNVKLELLLPVGYTIHLSDEMKRMIYDIDNVSNTSDRNMVGRRWTMTPSGLKCVDCEGLDSPNLRDSDDDLDELEELERELQDKQQELDREAERLEHEMEKLERELEEKQEELVDVEEANGSGEILLKRVINATYRISPTSFRTVSISYPG